MQREDILKMVIKHLKRNVEQLDEAAIDPSRSMLEMGASSLDVVEIVSAVIRELKIRVPRTELAKLKSLNGLVDLLHEKVNAGAGA